MRGNSKTDAIDSLSGREQLILRGGLQRHGGRAAKIRSHSAFPSSHCRAGWVNRDGDSWLTRPLQKWSRAMTAALIDSGFQRRRAPRAMSVPPIQGISKLAITLGPPREFELLVLAVGGHFCWAPTAIWGNSTTRQRWGRGRGVNLRSGGEFTVLFALIIGDMGGHLRHRGVHGSFADEGARRRARVSPGNDCWW
jgi:hypothetical protein